MGEGGAHMATVGATERTAQPASDRAFAIETHGIDSIPEGDRHGSPRELFSVWFAANVIFNYVITGAIIVGFGLNFWQAATTAAVYAVFVSDFTNSLLSFLSFMVVWAALRCAVYLGNIYL